MLLRNVQAGNIQLHSIPTVHTCSCYRQTSVESRARMPDHSRSIQHLRFTAAAIRISSSDVLWQKILLPFIDFAGGTTEGFVESGIYDSKVRLQLKVRNRLPFGDGVVAVSPRFVRHVAGKW